MDDNLSLDQDYIESLKQMYTGVWYDRMILGNWVAAEGRIYDMFDAQKNMIDTQAFIKSCGMSPKAIKWIVGCDYGTSTVMSWGLYGKLPNGTYLKVREYYYDATKTKVQKTDSEFADAFDEWIKHSGVKPWAVFCDPSAASWKTELMRRGYVVLNANNDVINGIRQVATMLNSGKYFIDKSCKNTELEYSTYSWDPTAQRQGKDRPIKEHDHTCDTDRYVIYTDTLNGMSGVYRG